jgi:hypothetical protein
MYASGKGTEKSDEAALACYEVAANGGDPKAQFTLANWISQERAGLKRDEDKIVSLTMNSAEKGHPGAQHNLALFYLSGECGITRDPSMAVQWFSRAAEQGLLLSQFNLGKMFKDGDGVEKDLDRAMFYFAMGANKNEEFKKFLEETKKEIQEQNK